MTRYLLVSVVSGIFFAVMDAVINANPLAQKLYAVYRPIARPSVNAPTGVAIDLAYGFALAGIFLLLFAALPGESGVVKGLSFALLVWFLRVVMSAAAQWMIIPLTASTLVYMLATGLAEMLLLGIFYGLTLRPRA